ncbi:MAG: hypothetical protein INQ03_23000 [Candidatus Heimdallarchaeota archaeon]|nr:hypothetical protein [Candidatus Heimdallarchaeota archaeon]
MKENLLDIRVNHFLLFVLNIGQYKQVEKMDIDNSIMSLKWNDISFYPSKALEPNKIFKISFPLGSLAGSVGKKIHDYKPGINEDGGCVVYSEDLRHIICIVIDGHKERDTTEILLDTFRDLIYTSQWIGVDDDFITFCHRLTEQALMNLREKQTVGWASYSIVGIDRVRKTLQYFSVGDVMIFAHDDKRHWGPYYQIDSRNYYEWINKDELIGYHMGRVKYNEGTELIIATDGLIDYPVIKMNNIEKIYSMKGSDCVAENLVRFALEHNQQRDDNITIIYLNTL